MATPTQQRRTPSLVPPSLAVGAGFGAWIAALPVVAHCLTFFGEPSPCDGSLLWGLLFWLPAGGGTVLVVGGIVWFLVALIARQRATP